MAQQDIEKQIQEVWALLEEHIQRFEEMRRELDRRSRETDRKLQETERLLKEQSLETNKKIQEVSTLIGRLGNKWGEFVEGLVIPAVKELFKAWKITVTRVSRRVEAQVNGRHMEVDVLAVNKDAAIAIEVKSTLSTADVDEFVKELEQIREFFPEFEDRKIYGAVAAVVMDDSVARYAYRKGLFVIAQKGDTVQILNDRKFKPRLW
ncbi:MAG: DUF3782 domain-containing protein [Calditrichaeota bacterium]|nr:MAG: DUF3782 domain-containing protein [Calditrichota bacterium]